jgi:formylmethanofuran dehydrogenase subunit E
MTSHFPDHAFLVSSKVALMKRGEFIDMGKPDEVITDSNLEKVYNIRVKVISVNSGVNRKVCVPLGECEPATASENIIDVGCTTNDFEFYLKKAGDFHGHVCAGIALGTKMTLAAMKALGLDPQVRNKNLIVYAEIDRCMTDAVQVITGCSLGHRSLKYVDYGKFAATFINLDTGRAVRATIREGFDSSGPIEEVSRTIAQMPDSDLVILQDVRVAIPETDLPGRPKKRAYCSACGERIMDGREVVRGDRVLCRACAQGKYYSEHPK